MASLKLLTARLNNAGEHLRWITATHGQDLDLITVDEVLYFRADHKYTLVVTASGETPIRLSVRELVDRLDPADVLADPPGHGGQRQCDRRRQPRLSTAIWPCA